MRGGPLGPSPGPPRRRRLLDDPYAPRQVAIHVALFLATVLSTLWVGAQWNAEALEGASRPGILDILVAGIPYSLTLMAILLCHEMGHFIAGRIHRVRLSLPFFVPIPFALGTFGAIIAMPPLESRRKLLDIGAAGPLAGLVVSTATMVVGLKLSPVEDLSSLGEGVLVYQEGQSLYYMLIKYLVLGPMPEGHDVMLHPVAWASWIGFLVTMLNLIPVGQLDGGHVAYALLGERQNRVSGWLHLGLVALGVGLGAIGGLTAWLGGRGSEEVWLAAQTGLPWLVWALVLWIFKRMRRTYHPPTVDPAPLGPGRIAVGLVCLALFVMLFMPVPLRIVQL